MKTSFTKYEYKAAKEFLSDAKFVLGFQTPTFSDTTYRKPDGTLWRELDSKLEAPEDDYSLKMVAA